MNYISTNFTSKVKAMNEARNQYIRTIKEADDVARKDLCCLIGKMVKVTWKYDGEEITSIGKFKLHSGYVEIQDFIHEEYPTIHFSDILEITDEI